METRTLRIVRVRALLDVQTDDGREEELTIDVSNLATNGIPVAIDFETWSADLLTEAIENDRRVLSAGGGDE